MLAAPQQARQAVLDLVRPLPALRAPPHVGSVLAEPVIASFDLPRFRNAAMDGFAIRCADLQRDGDEWVGSAGVPISTGQRVPGQADAVVPIERARMDGQRLRISGAVRPGDHVRSAGEELRAGDIALEAGTALTPPGVGLLAAMGVSAVAVIRRPRVGLLVTGDELVVIRSRVDEGEVQQDQIYDANGPMLAALVEQAGGEVIEVVRSKDDPVAIRAALLDLTRRGDLVITSGGTSVGKRDHVLAAVDDLGELIIRQLAIRPGRPTAAGLVEGKVVILLPGNPLALLVGYEVLARPVIRRLAGHHNPYRQRQLVDLRQVAGAPADRWRAMPVRLWPEQQRGAPARHLGSGMLSGAATADGLALIPPGSTDLTAVVVELW